MSQREHAVIGQPSRPSRGWKPPQVITSLLMVKEGGCCKEKRVGKTMGVNKSRQQNEGWVLDATSNPLTTQLIIDYHALYRYCYNTPNSNWHFKNYVERMCFFLRFLQHKFVVLTFEDVKIDYALESWKTILFHDWSTAVMLRTKETGPSPSTKRSQVLISIISQNQTAFFHLWEVKFKLTHSN
jgi:hypothetical protein